MRNLAADVRLHVTSAFADSITDVFRYCVPALAIGFALSLLLREKPLRSQTAATRRREEQGVVTVADPAAAMAMAEAPGSTVPTTPRWSSPSGHPESHVLTVI